VWLDYLPYVVMCSFVGLVHFGPLIVRRLALRWRVARLGPLLANAASTNQAKMIVANACVPSSCAMIWLDGLQAGVVIPDDIRVACVKLQFGKAALPQIRDLRCDEEGIGGTLRFDGQPVSTWVPWEAVYAIASSPGRPEWSWLDQISEETRHHLSVARYKQALECPSCGRAPFGGAWRCNDCGHGFDPFLGETKCPECGRDDSRAIECTWCHERSNLEAWRGGPVKRG
jgi:rubredoxin